MPPQAPGVPQQALAGARQRDHARIERRPAAAGAGGVRLEQRHVQQPRRAPAAPPRRRRPGRRRRSSTSNMRAAGRPRARRGIGPANPALTRASALLAGGARSNMSRPRLRSRPTPGRAIAEQLHQRVGEARPRRCGRARARRRSAAAAPPRRHPPAPAAITSASIAASRSPRLNPWPATGCSACAALPISTVRGATGAAARVSCSG